MTNADSLTKIIEDEVARFKEQVKLVESGYQSRYSLVFSENILVYLIQSMDPKKSGEDAREKANLLIERFGMNNYVIDNSLTKYPKLNRMDKKNKTRSDFNKLNDIGLLRQEREDGPFLIFNKKGEAYPKDWKLHYWMWDYNNIFGIFRDKKEAAEEFNIYSHLSDKAWAREKS